MILSLHTLAGAVLGSTVGNPLESSALALASHYFIDFLPHFDYKIENIQKGDWKSARPEFLKVSADLIISCIIITFVIYKNPANILSILSATFFSLFPDGLVLIYFIFNKNISDSFIGKLLLNHYEFHFKMHSKTYSVNTAAVIAQLLLIIFLIVMIFK